MHELTHLSDDALLRRVSTLTARGCVLTASLLAHLSEVDARKLYLALGHPSMFAYAVEGLRFSESAAYRRIHAARAARKFPRLFTIVAEGQLHLAAVCMLAPHLTCANFDELVAAAMHRSKAEVEQWLAVRFAPPLLTEAAATGETASVPEREPLAQHVPGRVKQDAPTESVPVASRTAPATALAPHVMLRLALHPSTHAKLRHAQALLGHALPGGDLAQVLDRVLDVFISQAEKRKYAATDEPREPHANAQVVAPKRTRTVPAHVKRAVWQRDQAQCAFVSTRGRRCSSRVRLEFDHIDPFARGGSASTAGVRLLCRAHNQFEAERIYGRAFMERRREQARLRQSAGSTRPGTSCEALGELRARGAAVVGDGAG
jgi:5-methylcytosine-specific restriction endonuclease McrA